MKILLILLTIASPAFAEETPFAKLLLGDPKLEARSQAATEDLEKCVRTCPKEDAQIAREMLDVFRAMKANPQSFDEQMKKLGNLTARSIDTVKAHKDLDSMFKLYDSAAGLVFGNKELLSDLAKKVDSEVPLLPVKYPREARAFSVYGNYLRGKGGEPLEVIRAFHQCVSLDPKNRSCRKSYDSAVTSYMQPHCKGRDLSASAIEFYGVSPIKARGYTAKKDAKGTTYYVEKRPVINASDINEIWASKSEFGDEVVGLNFTPEGSRKIADFTRDNLGRQLALVVNGKVVSAPTIKSEIKDGAQLSPGGPDGEGRFAKVCPHPTIEELPLDLKL